MQVEFENFITLGYEAQDHGFYNIESIKKHNLDLYYSFWTNDVLHGESVDLATKLRSP